MISVKSLLLCALLVVTNVTAAAPGAVELTTAMEIYLDDLAKSKDAGVVFNYLRIINCVEHDKETKCLVMLDAVVLYHVSYAATFQQSQRVVGKHIVTLTLSRTGWVITNIVSGE